MMQIWCGQGIVKSQNNAQPTNSEKPKSDRLPTILGNGKTDTRSQGEKQASEPIATLPHPFCESAQLNEMTHLPPILGNGKPTDTRSPGEKQACELIATLPHPFCESAQLKEITQRILVLSRSESATTYFLRRTYQRFKNEVIQLINPSAIHQGDQGNLSDVSFHPYPVGCSSDQRQLIRFAIRVEDLAKQQCQKMRDDPIFQINLERIQNRIKKRSQHQDNRDPLFLAHNQALLIDLGMNTHGSIFCSDRLSVGAKAIKQSDLGTQIGLWLHILDTLIHLSKYLHCRMPHIPQTLRASIPCKLLMAPNSTKSQTITDLEPIGEGAFASVLSFSYPGPPPQPKFAFKLFRHNHTNSIQQGLTEFKITSQLKHSNTMLAYDLGILISYNQFGLGIVMPFLSESLGKYLERTSSPSSIHQSIRWGNQLLRAVEFLHRQRIAHFDIKPDNILLENAYNLRLGDFGFACIYQSDTIENPKRGSRGYLPPEFWNASQVVPVLWDTWSTGVTIFETQRHHVHRDFHMGLTDSINTAFLALEDPGLKNVIYNSLQIEPTDRHTPKQLRKDLYQKTDINPNSLFDRSLSALCDHQINQLIGHVNHLPNSRHADKLLNAV